MTEYLKISSIFRRRHMKQLSKADNSRHMTTSRTIPTTFHIWLRQYEITQNYNISSLHDQSVMTKI